MPLIFVQDIDTETRLGLWRIADELHIDEVCPQMVCEELKQKCEKRRKETIAVYALLHAMTGRANFIIEHNTDGKPQLNDYFISISHTKGYASIIMSKNKEVAIDIEYRNNRVFRIVDKFITKQEQIMLKELTHLDVSTLRTMDIVASATNCYDAQTALLLCWCAKETMYKYFSEHRLMFDEMQNELKEIKPQGTFDCLNLRHNIRHSIRYIQNEEFILTYTV